MERLPLRSTCIKALLLITIFSGVASRLARAEDEKPIAELTGKDFKGGGAEKYGSKHYDTEDVNYVYAQGNGEVTQMKATFMLDKAPDGVLQLHVTGRNDYPKELRLFISVNGKILFSSESEFPKDKWKTLAFEIPEKTLRAGANEVEFENLEVEGLAGMPPFFMISKVAIASDKYKPKE
jgi:hypothetical protein